MRRPEDGIPLDIGDTRPDGGTIRRRQTLYKEISAHLKGVVVPSDVVRAATGIMDGLVLKTWWMTPNIFFYQISPQELWSDGKSELVIDLIFALKGDQRSQIGEAFAQISRDRMRGSRPKRSNYFI